MYVEEEMRVNHFNTPIYRGPVDIYDCNWLKVSF